MHTILGCLFFFYLSTHKLTTDSARVCIASVKENIKKKKKDQMYSKVHNEISNGNFSLILSPFSFELLQHHFIWKAQGEINKKQRIQNMCQISFKSEKI